MNTLLNLHKTKFINKTPRCLTSKLSYSMSYLQNLYEFSKQNKSPFFRVDSHHIRIIEDPLDFYISLKKGIQSSNYRIGLSCLYLGTGNLQRFLLRQIKKKKQSFKDIDITMVFDYNRSLRQQKGQSPVHMLYQWKQQLGPGNVKVAFNRNSLINGVLGQVMGVHHQKMAIFDNQVIIGGANMSQSYFLNRKDRYMQFKECDDMSNYLYEYMKILAQNSYQYTNQNKIGQKGKNLQNHFKLWSMAYRPPQFKDDIVEQQKYLDKIQKQMQEQQKRNIQIKQVKRKQIELVSRNQQIARQIGTSIKIRDEVDQKQYHQRLQNARDRLFGVKTQEFVGNQIEMVQNSYWKGNQLTQRGEKVYIFPFMHYPKLNLTNQPQFFQKILRQANKNNHHVKISSGYLNLSQNLLNVLSQTQQKQTKQKNTNKVQILCSAPQANSFYQGGRLKKYIPFYYRCFQIDILKNYNKDNKISIHEFNKNDQWSFHSKGVWIKQAENSYLTVLGSSNYNGRSQKSDIELQLYMYSTCQKFNKRLDKQYENMKEYCNKVQLEQLQNDPEIKCSGIVKFFSKLFKRFL